MLNWGAGATSRATPQVRWKRAGGAGPLGTRRLVEPGHVCLVPAASKPSVIGGQSLANDSESWTATHKCSFGNASGDPLCNAVQVKHAALSPPAMARGGSGESSSGAGGHGGCVKWFPLSARLSSFEPRGRFWGRHWPWGAGQKWPPRFLSIPSLNSTWRFRTAGVGMVRRVHQSPAHFAEPEKWMATIWGERVKKRRGHFIPKRKGSPWAKSQASPSQWSSLGWERLWAGRGIRTGGDVLAAVCLVGVSVVLFWEQGRTWGLRWASGGFGAPQAQAWRPGVGMATGGLQGPEVRQLPAAFLRALPRPAKV